MAMDQSHPAIPQEAKQAADRGDIIAAIKITREATGLGLKEAKDAVDAYSRGASGVSGTPENVEFPLDAIASLHQGNLIEAIRITREKTGLGLKESKDAVERHLAQNPNINQLFQTAAARKRGGVWWRIAFPALVLAAIAGYLWLSGQSS